MMDNLKVVGVGCFGKPETVARLFTKMVKIYPMDMHLQPSVNAISGFRLGLDNQVLKLSVISKRRVRKSGNEPADNFSLIFES